MADGTPKHCSAAGCVRTIRLQSTTTDGQKRELADWGWFPMARKGGKLAAFCPEHKPKGTPSSMGRSTP
jgi:hypothetical protein